MTSSESMLDKEPEELGRLLLEAARQDGAPAAARERALLSVTSVALGMGVGVASSAVAFGSRTSVAKASGWLVAKWLAVGLSSGVVTIAVAQEVQQAITSHTQPALPAAALAVKQVERVPVSTVRERPVLDPQNDVPVASSTTVASAAQTALAPAVVSAPPAYGVVPAPQSAAEPAASALPAAKDTTSTLTRELSLLEQARAALAQHSAPRALQALNDYRAQFPNGSLQAEAAALRVEAAGQAGDRALAERLAASFLVSYPTSPLAARVRALSDTSRSNAQTP